jgi:DNA-directed RNA polymerase subunit RPC12/RpoP
MLVSGIKSRPVYPGLEPDTFAKHNIVATDGHGCAAVIEMMAATGDAFTKRCTVLLCTKDLADSDRDENVRALSPATVWLFPTLETMLSRLDGMLPTARMGTRLYAAGSEPLIGSTVKTAMAHGIDHRSVSTEHRGSHKRRVQCVHCKGMTEDVTTNPVRCAHCGHTLLVRDHYSRRLGAFMGVRIDAEVPGEIPNSIGEFQ